MDFFANQERARRNTTLLVFFYLLAVCLIILAVYTTFAVALSGSQGPSEPGAPQLYSLWNPELFLWVVGGTVIVIASGMLYKISQLSAGGQVVATMLGGRKLENQTRNIDERKILNVVEEMAIASGLPPPPVYMLDNEPGINAFAAGFSPRDAVIGVTAGCVQQLSRDQLQGVIAHEFSHILNGDMKLNIKMIGLLNGILVIAVIGYWVMCSTSRSRNSKGENNAPFIIIGLVLMIVGYIGVFFGNIIKAAISRQREFYADAAAVQFTRNPEGIAGALKKIGGFDFGSKLETPNAPEASHMFFSSGITGFLSGLFATHPPLAERIKRLDGTIIPEMTDEESSESSDAVSGFTGARSQSKLHLSPEKTVAKVGTPTQENADFAATMLSKIPRSLIEAANSVYGARAVIFALLLDEDKNSKTRQIQENGLKNQIDEQLFKSCLTAADEIAGLWQGYRLPLANMSVAALKEISSSQYFDFIKIVDFLAMADNKIDLFEHMISRLVRKYLDPEAKKSKGVKYNNKSQLLEYCADLISCLAFWGTDDDNDAKKAFEAGIAKFNAGNIEMRSRAKSNTVLLDAAIDVFSLASPQIKRSVIESCVATIAADNLVTIEEAEVLRSVSAALDCPMPPFLPGDVV
jgi:Zn-dependent protease with chaperone function